MARGRNPAWLVIALSVAAVLAIFLVYTSLAGGGTPMIQPSEVAAQEGVVQLGGIVVGPVEGDARGDGLRFTLRDVKGDATVPVVYTGSVPDMFREGREIMVRGELANGVFTAERDSLVTKCPSKYSPAESE
jgi:cytochrome c-type biogenesis protein CcmE